MNPVLKFILLMLAFPLLGYGQEGSTQPVANPFIKKEFYANGKIKRITRTKTKVPRNIDLFNFYKTTKVTIHEYDSITGNLVLHSVRVTKVGIGGKHCYEYFSRITIYESNGKKKHFEKSRCDRNKSMYKDYDKGKVIFIHKEKNKRRKR